METVTISAKTGSEDAGNLKEFTADVEMPETLDEAGSGS